MTVGNSRLMSTQPVILEPTIEASARVASGVPYLVVKDVANVQAL